MPSALDRPRFADDAPLSEWVAEGRGAVGAVAALGTLGEQPTFHEQGTPWPQPRSDDDPISVELVRGHDGPGDDTWTVVVDGVRCARAPASGVDPVNCFLTPPFRTENGDGSPYIPAEDTLVRSLAVAVRLENEARTPARAQLVIEQVCRSDERRNRALSARDEVIEIGRMDVSPYSVRDPVAKAVIVPYPFSAPAQSALAICSYREVELWQERMELRQHQIDEATRSNERRRGEWEQKKEVHDAKNGAQRLINDGKRQENDAAEQQWEGEKAQIDTDHEAQVEAWNNEKAEVDAEHADAVQAWQNSAAPRGPRPQRAKYPDKPKRGKYLNKPKKQKIVKLFDFAVKKPVDRAVKPLEEPKVNTNQRPHVIGGQGESAARSLIPMLKRLTELCKEVRRTSAQAQREAQEAGLTGEQLANAGGTLQSNGQIMRDVLHDKNESSTLALFDALTNGTPVDPEFVRAADVENPDDATPTAVATRQVKRPDTQTELVYDRISIVPRLRTTTFLRMRIEVTEHSGVAPASVLLRTREYEAVAAHSVYAGHYQDLLDFDAAAVEFLDCLDEMKAERSVASTALEKTRFIYRVGADLWEWLRGRTKPKKPLNVEQVTEMLNELRVVMRAMVLPAWPAPPDASLDDVLALADDADDPTAGPAPVAFEPDEEAPEPLAPPLPPPPPTTTLALRQLPQIVSPQRNNLPGLRPPVDVSPPDEFAPSSDGSYGYLRMFFSLTLGLAIAGAGGYGAYVALQAFTAYTVAAAATAQQATFAFSTLWEGAAAAFDAFTWTGVFRGVGAAFARAAGSGARLAAEFAATLAVQTGLNAWTAASTSIPIGWKAGSYIIERGRLASKNYNLRESIYWRAVRAAKGVPVLSSLASARGALSALSKKATESKTRINSFGDTDALYSSESGARWRFAERYRVNVQRLDSASRRSVDADWASGPDSTAMMLLPPADVSEQLYDAEVLRKVPLSDASTRTTGSPDKNVATSPAELAAAAAHRELATALSDGRFPFTGEHIGISAARSALVLAEQGARLLDAAYGEKAGITLVKGNDAIWSCLGGGPAARLAVRHFELFERADGARRRAQAGGVTVTDLVKTEVNGWRFTQRALMSEFSQAWVAVARRTAQQAEAVTKRTVPGSLPPPNLRGRVQEVARTFARVSVLAEEQSRVFAVAAQHHTLLAMDSEVKALVQEFLPAALIFQDQAGYTNAHHGTMSLLHSEATWAARRMDPEPQRELAVGKGVDNVVRKLAGLDLEADDDATMDYGWSRHYYCPLGARLDSMPGSVPFAVDSLGQRVVWLQHLRGAAVRLGRSTRQGNPPPRAQGSVHVGTMQELTGREPVWLARHPLVVAAQPGVVTARFDTSERRGWPTVTYADEPATIASMVALQGDVQSRAAAGAFVRDLASRSRIVAYDADRMVNALALAATQSEHGEVVRVVVNDRLRMLSLALALAVLAVESQGLHNELLAHVPDAAPLAEAQQLLEELVVRVDAALSKGCKVVSLAEACVAFV